MDDRLVIFAGNSIASFSRVSDRIEQQLRRLIVTSELPPGAVVTEAYLSERLNCSRTPLREALQRLAQEHLVIAVPRRGITVPELGLVDFGHLIEAVDGIERFAAGLSARRITATQLGTMAGILAEAERAGGSGDFASVIELDFEFHQLLAKATGNRYIVEVHTRLYRLITRFAYIAYKRAGTCAPSLAEHHLILEAVTRHDPVESERQVLGHLSNGRNRITSHLA